MGLWENSVDDKKPFGSTDMGNVSYELPSLHPMFGIGTDAPIHTTEFARVAGSPTAQQPTLKQAQILALVGLNLCQLQVDGKLQECLDQQNGSSRKREGHVMVSTIGSKIAKN